eukprot:ANDGO_02532.mRNA.1 hypothetical protein
MAEATKTISVEPRGRQRHYNTLVNSLPQSYRKLLRNEMSTTAGHRSSGKKPRCTDKVPREVPHSRSIISEVKQARGPAYDEMVNRVQVKQSTAAAIRAADESRLQEKYVEKLKCVADPKVLSTSRRHPKEDMLASHIERFS